MRDRSQQVTEEFEEPISEIVGKRVVRAVQHSGDFHGLDEGFALDGEVVIEFDDGSVLSVVGAWCNDSTAATDVTLNAAPLTSQ